MFGSGRKIQLSNVFTDVLAFHIPRDSHDNDDTAGMSFRSGTKSLPRTVKVPHKCPLPEDKSLFSFFIPVDLHCDVVHGKITVTAKGGDGQKGQDGENGRNAPDKSHIKVRITFCV